MTLDRSNITLQDIGPLWLIEKPCAIYLSWDKRTFFGKSTIEWRGKIIHIRIIKSPTWSGQGWSSSITFLCESNIYDFGFTKWKQWGSYGGAKPEIKTLTHNLKVTNGTNWLRLTDEEFLVQNSYQTGVHPFRILQSPTDIQFDSPGKKAINKSK